MHDPLFAEAILNDAARQIYDPKWPNEPGERELVVWRTPQVRDRRSLLTVVRTLVQPLIGRPRLQTPVPAPASANDV